MSDPVLLVVSGEVKARKVQALFNPSVVVVLPFESATYFPSAIRAALVVMPEESLIGAHRLGKFEAWLNEFVRPRLADQSAFYYL